VTVHVSPNALRNQALSVGALIPEQTRRLEADLRKIVPAGVQHATRHVVITGCGDSAIAARAAEQSFRMIAGLPTVAVDAMTASRYLLPVYGAQYPHTPLLFAISNSGKVSRVVEAALRAKAVGGYVVALTKAPNSPLAEVSDVVLDIGAPAFPSSPGVRSYVMALLALNLFAIRFGEVRARITMDQAKALRKELSGLGEVADELADRCDVTLAQAAHDWAGLGNFEILGSGPSRASASYAAAKILEATGRHAVGVDIEEFVHLNYFVRDAERTATVVLAGPGQASLSRATEVAEFLNTLRRPWLAIGDVAGAPVSTGSPRQVREEFLPLVQTAPLALFAAHLMDEAGETPGRGSVGQWADCANGGTTTTSIIEGMN